MATLNNALSEDMHSYREAMRLQEEIERQIVRDIETIADSVAELAPGSGSNEKPAVEQLAASLRNFVDDIARGGSGLLLPTASPLDWDEIERALKRRVRVMEGTTMLDGVHDAWVSRNRRLRALSDVVAMVEQDLARSHGTTTIFEMLGRKTPDSPDLIRAARTFEGLKTATDLADGRQLGGTFFGKHNPSDTARGLEAGGDFGHVVMHARLNRITNVTASAVIATARARQLLRVLDEVERRAPGLGLGSRSAEFRDNFLQDIAEGMHRPLTEVLPDLSRHYLGDRYALLITEARHGRVRAFDAYAQLPPDPVAMSRAADVALNAFRAATQAMHDVFGIDPMGPRDSDQIERSEAARRALIDWARTDADPRDLHLLRFSPVKGLIQSDAQVLDRLLEWDATASDQARLPSEVEEWLMSVRSFEAPVQAASIDRPQLFEQVMNLKRRVSENLFEADRNKAQQTLETMTAIRKLSQRPTIRLLLATSTRMLPDTFTADNIRELLRIATNPSGQPLSMPPDEMLKKNVLDENAFSSELAIELFGDVGPLKADVAYLKALEGASSLGHMTPCALRQSNVSAGLAEMIDRDPERVLEAEIADAIHEGQLSPDEQFALARENLFPMLAVQVVKRHSELPPVLRHEFETRRSSPQMRRAIEELEKLTQHAVDATANVNAQLEEVVRAIARVENLPARERKGWLGSRGHRTPETVSNLIASKVAVDPRVREVFARSDSVDGRLGSARTADVDESTSRSQPGSAAPPKAPSPKPSARSALSAALEASAQRRSAETQRETAVAVLREIVESAPVEVQEELAPVMSKFSEPASEPARPHLRTTRKGPLRLSAPTTGMRHVRPNSPSLLSGVEASDAISSTEVAELETNSEEQSHLSVEDRDVGPDQTL